MGSYIAAFITEGDDVLPVSAHGAHPGDPAGPSIPQVVAYGASPPGADPATIVDDPPISFDLREGPGEGLPNPPAPPDPPPP